MSDKLFKAVNRLSKWRSVFSGWQLGTRSDSDPECQAVRDHRELTMILRAEQTALVTLLIDKGFVKLEDYHDAVAKEADLLSADYAKRFPGFKASDIGMEINAVIAADTTRGWRP